eukprot:1929013-Pleurochrysis_carterae.AAC.1
MRFPVPDDKVAWNVEFPEYAPADYTSASEQASMRISEVERRELDHRMTVEVPVPFDEQSGEPRNPRGRTGITGRGALKLWGPNQAVYPIITRWDAARECNQVYALKNNTVQWELPSDFLK